MAMVVVDTAVLSYQFKGDTRARLYDASLAGQLWIISFMTLAGSSGGPCTDAGGQRRREQLATHLRRVQVYYADEDLCDWWAEVIRRARRRGRPIEPSDAWIAATALALDVPLVTHNPADYAGVDGLTVVSEAMP